MTTAQAPTPVSPDRVLAGALRLTLVPVIDHRRAVHELDDLALGQAQPLRQALARLESRRDGASASRTAARAADLLREALALVDHRSGRQLARTA